MLPGKKCDWKRLYSQGTLHISPNPNFIGYSVFLYKHGKWHLDLFLKLRKLRNIFIKTANITQKDVQGFLPDEEFWKTFKLFLYYQSIIHPAFSSIDSYSYECWFCPHFRHIFPPMNSNKDKHWQFGTLHIFTYIPAI